MIHPPEELLIQHVLGIADLTDHLTSCSGCSVEVSSIRDSTESSSKDPGYTTIDWIGRSAHVLERERELARLQLEETADEELETSIPEVLLSRGGLPLLLDRIAATRRHSPVTALAIACTLNQATSQLSADQRVEICREAAACARAVGSYESASGFLDSAEALIHQLPVPDFPLARIWYERARIDIDRGIAQSAARYAERSAEAFLRFGDDRRHNRSLYLLAVSRYNDRDYKGTIDALLLLLPRLELAEDRETIALCYSLVGHASLKEDLLVEAMEAFDRASAYLATLDWPIERLRAEWGIARVLLKLGRVTEAVELGDHVREGFESHGLVEEAGLVGLDLVEALIVDEQPDKARALCQSVVETLGDRLSTEDERRAVAYLQETALTASRVNFVSTFLREHREDPTIPFTSPS